MEELLVRIAWTFLQILSILLLILVIGLVLYTVYIIYIRWKYSHFPGPPIKGFYGGNLSEVREYYKRGEYSHKLFYKWALVYRPVFRVFILHRCILLVTGTDLIKELLTKSKYRKCPQTYNNIRKVCGVRFLGQGLVTNVDHDNWYIRRSSISPAFHKKYLRKLMEHFNSTADQWISLLTSVADGKTTINMAEYMNRVTLEVIGKVGFNYEIGALEEGGSPFTEGIARILEGFSKSVKDPLMALRPSKRSFRKSVQNAVHFLRHEGRRILEQRMKEIKEGQNVPDDFLTFIIKSSELLPSLTMDDMLDEFATLFVAGQETTSNTLSFLLHELGRHPDVYHKLMKEVETIMGDEDDVSFEKISELEYMSQVLKETLRLYPPAPATVRTTQHDAHISGHLIPKGARIVISFYVVHRLPDYHHNPEQFDPERFSSDKPSPLYTYMPFSMGQRSCAGRHFAMIEAKVLLCKFLSRFKFSVDPTHELDVQEAATLKPRGGCRLVLSLIDQG